MTDTIKSSIIQMAIRELMHLSTYFEKNYDVTFKQEMENNRFYLEIRDKEGVQLLKADGRDVGDYARLAMLDDATNELRELIKFELVKGAPSDSLPGVMLHGGNFVELNNVESLNVEIDVIAHHLSRICRFNGATEQHYSVAQHSVLVSLLVPREHQLSALLHDAAEMIVGDIQRPVAGLFRTYQAYHDRFLRKILKEFGLPFPLHPCVKDADEKALATEVRDLMPAHATAWAPLSGITPLRGSITPIPAENAKDEFIQRFYEILNNKTLKAS